MTSVIINGVSKEVRVFGHDKDRAILELDDQVFALPLLEETVTNLQEAADGNPDGGNIYERLTGYVVEGLAKGEIKVRDMNFLSLTSDFVVF